MMAFDLSTRSRRAILFLFVFIGIPSVARSSTLEDFAKELARKIGAVLPAHEDLSLEIQNLSSLQPDDAARIERALKAELQERGIRLFAKGAAATAVEVKLSENLKELVWTAEIRQFDEVHVILTVVARSSENRAISTSMPVTIRSERIWEGPNRILDALEIVSGTEKSRLILLLSDGVLIQDRQTDSVDTIEIKSDQSARRDPVGFLKEITPYIVALYLGRQSCNVNLESPTSLSCSPRESVSEGGIIIGHLSPIALAQPTRPPTGKGSLSGVMSVCGSANRFLATGAGDDTEADSLQLFEMTPSGAFETTPSGAVAVSPELKFPGPITALDPRIVGQDWPSVVVRNLTTGNYEAYRLSFSCGQ